MWSSLLLRGNIMKQVDRKHIISIYTAILTASVFLLPILVALGVGLLANLT